MSFLKITALTSAAFLAAFLGYKYLTADPPGYCAEQKRVIPDEEIFANYLDAKIKGGQLKLAVTEMTGREYLANHPDCCHVDWSWKARFRSQGLIYALFNDSGVLSIRYEMSDLGKKPHGATSTTHMGELSLVSPCSKVWDVSGFTD